MVENVDQRSGDYSKIKDSFRPGHADYTYQQKYGIRDYRGGGRASARETVMRVAAGAIARKYLAEHLGLKIRGYLAEIGPFKLRAIDLDHVDDNPFFCADPDKLPQLEAFLDELRAAGDSIGARINLIASGVPVGLGRARLRQARGRDRQRAHEHQRGERRRVRRRLRVRAAARQRASRRADAGRFQEELVGRNLGGISSGQDILVSIALKPTSSIQVPGATVDKDGRATEIVTTGRHDPCVGLRATPIAEAMLALTLLDHYLRHRAQNADVRSSMPVLAARQGP